MVTVQMCFFFKWYTVLLLYLQLCKIVSSKYIVSDEKVTFFEGFARCKQYGLNPLEIRSHTEERELEAVLPTIQAGWEFGYWIFATNLGNNQTYYWLNSGKPLLYSNYNAFEPNNPNGDENCLEILNVATGRNFKWNDVPCNVKLKFVCQSKESLCESPNSADGLL